MKRICSSVLLFQKGRSQAWLIDSLPEPPADDVDIDEIKFLAFPNELKEGQQKIYAFNTEKHFCACWVFRLADEDVQTAIVIVADQFRPCLFNRFFKSASACCQSQNITDARSRHVLVYSALKSTTFTSETDFVIRFPNENMVVRPDNNASFWVKCRNCSTIGKRMGEIWETLMANGRVAVIGNDSETVSLAVIEVMSLFCDIQFCESFVTFSQEGELRPDFLKKCQIVGTTDKAMAAEGFDLVVEVKRNAGNFEKETRACRAKTTRCYTALQSLWKSNQAYHPFFNMIGEEITCDPALGNMGLLSDPSFVAKLQLTATFSNWKEVSRMQRLEKERSAFLSISPSEAVSRLRDDQLVQAYNGLVERIGEVPSDVHFATVLNRNLSLIKKRMANM